MSFTGMRTRQHGWLLVWLLAGGYASLLHTESDVQPTGCMIVMLTESHISPRLLFAAPDAVVSQQPAITYGSVVC